ncbi:MAG: hypothetical protein ABL999_10140 [Pyrinomonadaceae bacterium]
MVDCTYWQDIVGKLRSNSTWAAHVLATDEHNLSEALKCVDEEIVIENTIFAYREESAQPYCDEVLLQFDKEKVRAVFVRMIDANEDIKKLVERFLDL